MRNISDDEEDEISDEKTFDQTCKPLHVKDMPSENKDDGIENGHLNNGENGLQNGLAPSTLVDTSKHESEISGQIDKKNDVDTRLALRENTFVTNDASLTTTSSASDHANYGGNQSVTPQVHMALTNYPFNNFEVRLSRYRLLDLDRIKNELTTSRRGVFIMQALRWVGL